MVFAEALYDAISNANTTESRLKNVLKKMNL